MTQTNQPEANPLLTLIVTLLAPTFLGVTAGDLTLARMSAAHTINHYRARNHADLIAIAQIIACGLAALGSLSLSMDDDIALSMTLRLRGNAVALNRSAEQNRRVLQQPIRDTPTPYHADPTPQPETPSEDEFLTLAAAQILAQEAESRLLPPPEQTVDLLPTTGDKRHQEMWAIAMVHEAAEITASVPNLPPAERSAASIRAAALGSTANELLTGASSSPPHQPNPP